MNIGCPCRLRVAEKGLYRPLWSDRILAEAQAATEEIHPGVDAGKRSAQMREAFDDALVTGWENSSRESGCPTRTTGTCSRRRSGVAQGIITANTKDFPAAALEPLVLEAVRPDNFLLDQPDLSPPTILQVIREQGPHQKATAHPVRPGDPAWQGRHPRLRRRDSPSHGQPPGRHLTGKAVRPA